MKVIDLMSGIGGRSLGFKEAGYDIIYAIDNDKDNADVYRKILEQENFVVGSILNVDPSHLPDADVILGKLFSNFSVVAQNKNTLREAMDNAIFSIIEHKKPPIFVLEAPVGILARNSRENVEKLLTKYINIGYSVVYNTFSENEYSGYPVVGKQLFFIGTNKGLLKEEYYFPEPIFFECKCNFFREIDNAVNGWYRKVSHIDDIEYIEGKYYLRERGKIAEAERIHMGLFREMYIVDSIGLRKFTHNELASLKGFKNYDFNQCSNKQKMYTRIAYAANVYVVKAIAESLKKYDKSKSSNEESDVQINRKNKKKKVKKVVFPKQKIVNIHIDRLKGLKNLDIPIESNLTAIMGVNGSGKSTILHALACMFSPYEAGDNYKFSFFFTPNPDSNWKNSKLSLTYYDENEQKEITRIYKKDSDRWSPRYRTRPVRDVFFVGIETCIPEIEIEKQTSFIDYSTNSTSGELERKIIHSAAYILNKDYESLTIHKTRKKDLIGVHTLNDLTYSSLSMGAGEQRVLKILRLIYSVNQYSLILIDEIDLLLHVTALKKLIIELSKIAVKRNLQIIFTTHSLEMINLKEYTDIRYLEALEQKTIVYKSINVDMIYEMSNHVQKPIEIYVEDLLAEAIIKRLAEELNILGNIKIIKFGAVGNAFVVASSFVLKSEDYSNVAIVLDGDVYREHEEKEGAVKRVLSGTEKNHEEKVMNAVSIIKQFTLPLNVEPEKYVFDMLVEMDSNNEIVKYAKNLKAVSNSHEWLDELTTRIGQEEMLILSRIIDIVSENAKWENYVENIREWMRAKKQELNLEKCDE